MNICCSPCWIYHNKIYLDWKINTFFTYLCIVVSENHIPGSKETTVHGRIWCKNNWLSIFHYTLHVFYGFWTTWVILSTYIWDEVTQKYVIFSYVLFYFLAMFSIMLISSFNIRDPIIKLIIHKNYICDYLEPFHYNDLQYYIFIILTVASVKSFAFIALYVVIMKWLRVILNLTLAYEQHENKVSNFQFHKCMWKIKDYDNWKQH